MITTKNTRIDSIAERSRIMSGASIRITPPDHIPLDIEETKYFDNIIREFPKADWTAHQIELAALLARMMADFKFESELLRKEGATVAGAMGGTVTNPRKQVVQMHGNNIISFRRSLALHAASHGDTRDVAKRTEISRHIEAKSEFDDDLIARPN